MRRDQFRFQGITAVGIAMIELCPEDDNEESWIEIEQECKSYFVTDLNKLQYYKRRKMAKEFSKLFR